MLEDGHTDKGGVNAVIRIGDTIRRPVNRWTAAIHSLLRYLEDVGFQGTPRVHGLDEMGREVISFIQGEVALRPWPRVLLEEEGLIKVGEFLARYHGAVKGFVPPKDAEWHVPGLEWQPGKVIRHGDIGPWNTVWEGNTLNGIIDWDFAEPGSPLDDLAQFAWYAVPLRGETHWSKAGFKKEPDLKSRLWALCDGYGTDVTAVLDALLLLQEEESRRTESLGRQGIHPWSIFHQRGDSKEIMEESTWLRTKRELLIG